MPWSLRKLSWVGEDGAGSKGGLPPRSLQCPGHTGWILEMCLPPCSWPTMPSAKTNWGTRNVFWGSVNVTTGPFMSLPGSPVVLQPHGLDSPLTWTWRPFQATPQPLESEKCHRNHWEQFREDRVRMLQWVRPLLWKDQHRVTDLAWNKRKDAYWRVSVKNNRPFVGRETQGGNSTSQLPRSALLGPGWVRLQSPRAKMLTYSLVFLPTLGSGPTLARHICDYLSSQNLKDQSFVVHIKPWGNNPLSYMVYSPFMNSVNINLTLALNRNEQNSVLFLCTGMYSVDRGDGYGPKQLQWQNVVMYKAKWDTERRVQMSVIKIKKASGRRRRLNWRANRVVWEENSTFSAQPSKVLRVNLIYTWLCSYRTEISLEENTEDLGLG